MPPCGAGETEKYVGVLVKGLQSRDYLPAGELFKTRADPTASVAIPISLG